MRKVESSKVYRLLYPVVPVVIAAAIGEEVAAMPVASLVSLSDEPAMVGFSSSPEHRTYGAIIDAGAFSVSWLDRRFGAALESLGTSSGKQGGDKLRSVGIVHRPGSALSTPIPESASAFLECRFSMSQKFGDHRLVVGEVKGAYADEDFGAYWTFERYKPNLYAGMKRSFPYP